jgi:hypothetical protein
MKKLLVGLLALGSISAFAFDQLSSITIKSNSEVKSFHAGSFMVGQEPSSNRLKIERLFERNRNYVEYDANVKSLIEMGQNKKFVASIGIDCSTIAYCKNVTTVFEIDNTSSLDVQVDTQLSEGQKNSNKIDTDYIVYITIGNKKNDNTLTINGVISETSIQYAETAALAYVNTHLMLNDQSFGYSTFIQGFIKD